MFKLVKKTETTPLQAGLLTVGASISALVAAALIMALLGYNPLEIYGTMIAGSTGSIYRLQETINKAIPLCVLSLGVGMAFKMKFWNIGAEGQFYMGAYGASFMALTFPALPMFLMLPSMIIAGFVLGGLWAMIAAVLKAKLNTNETLTTLMLNYIAIRWISYLQYGPWRDPAANGFPRITRFTENAVLPDLFGVHIGWIITLVLVVLIYILLKYSKLGYEIAVLGENETTARYAGMSVSKVMIITIMISGGLCGLAGMMQASAIEGSLSDKLSGGLGFTAIITAWLAHLNPIVAVFVSLLFAMLIQGGSYLQSALQIPAAVSQILQGIILFFVLGSEFFTQYRIVSKKKLAKMALEADKK